MENKLNTLILDIETKPLLAYVWGLKDQNISLTQIKEDSEIMSYAAKWLGKRPVFYDDTRSDKSDKRLLQGLWKLLDKADFVITQNGINFDMPRIEARMMLNRMEPFSPIKNWDTYKKNKNKGFTSHKLEYLTDKLNDKYKKLDHKEFPGWSLWIECLKGNIKAWDCMKKYNIHDVLSTEELYQNTKAWVKQELVTPETEIELRECPTCKEKTRCYSNGIRVANGKPYRRLKGLCGHSIKGAVK